jgi:N-acetyl-gamma-glutamyl-phosphate reductase
MPDFFNKKVGLITSFSLSRPLGGRNLEAMLRVGIVGASGYTGSELIRLLVMHPEQIDLACVTSRTFAGQYVSRVLPNLRCLLDLRFENLDMEEVADRADIAFLGLPHTSSMMFAPKLFDLGVKVIDFSADYRLRSADVYERWYQEHASPHLLKEAVYGLPELYRAEIRVASLIANPGCYPTGVILGLLPALKSGVGESGGIIVDSKTGLSGAGRTPSEKTHLPSHYDNFTAYSIGAHRHTPEIEQELSRAMGKDISICFVPHLVPMSRGILTTAYLKLSKSISTADLLEIYSRYYEDEPFVRVLDEGEIPQTQAVRGSNYCDIGVKVLQELGLAVVISAIDNLTKGASGQALQNMNIVAGFDETAGLLYPGLMP